MIVTKTYVINLKNRPDRWKNIQNDFKNVLNLTRWDATDGNSLSPTFIKENVTPLCKKICTKSIIGCWTSHYNIWKNIVKNNEDNVLVLEDDTAPVVNFLKILSETEFPNDWDIIFLANFASRFGIKKKLYKNISKPYMLFGTSAYMISNKGAQKLLNDENFKKVSYHIDNVLTRKNNGKYNIYSFDPEIIKTDFTTNYSSLQDNTYKPISYLLSKIKIKEMPLDFFANTVHFKLPYTSIKITGIKLLIYILLIYSIFKKNNYIINAILFIQLISLFFTTNYDIFFELFITIIVIIVYNKN